MIGTIKNQKSILGKLGIESLNPMQLEAQATIHAHPEIVLLSPTGTGKTVAFLLPLLAALDVSLKEVQLLIITPSRELAIQIEQVTRQMGTGFKVNAFYGGRSFSKDRLELKHKPAILIGTPGRIADHLRRETFDPNHIEAIVLDEFDKSLEVGFETEMIQIIDDLPQLNKKILTSATQEVEIPQFVAMSNAKYINYLDKSSIQLTLKTIISPSKDKLETLVEALCHLGNQPGIIFCNYKASIQRVSDFLNDHNISHGCFFGGMEQKDRERSLIKFRNGTHQIIIATDLAARGIDVPEIKFIIHYQLPHRKSEFTHRNGRTARMHNDGTAYILQWKKEPLPEFIENATMEVLLPSATPPPSEWTTLFISGGRKDKISKGDIAGLLFKQGKLEGNQIGNIELKGDCAFVAVKKLTVKKLLPLVNNTKLKKKKVRITEI